MSIWIAIHDFYSLCPELSDRSLPGILRSISASRWRQQHIKIVSQSLSGLQYWHYRTDESSCRDCPVHCRTLNSIPGPYPLDTGRSDSQNPVVTCENVSRHCQLLRCSWQQLMWCFFFFSYQAGCYEEKGGWVRKGSVKGGMRYFTMEWKVKAVCQDRWAKDPRPLCPTQAGVPSRRDSKGRDPGMCVCLHV